MTHTAETVHIPSRVREIIAMIADQHQVSVEAILGPSTTRVISTARQAAYYAVSQARTPSGRRPSLSEIGRWIGNRDHTSVAHGITRHLYPADTRPSSIAVLKIRSERGDLGNVLPVDSETQARVLEQYFAMKRRARG